ncbi:MAG: hypothetical protein GYA85_09495 [Propionibacterium sp.]|nr:hypothetical protein [Propionibacterium sp.]
MSSPTHTLPRSDAEAPASARGAALLAVTAAIVFFTTGAGMLEGHAVYPSWYDLAAFPGFAQYHARYGLALLPWLPLPLLVATLLNVWLLFRRPLGVSRWLPIATLLAQLFVIGVTVAFALPLQAQLSTPGHSAAEIAVLVDRLTVVGWWRDLPGLATAVGYLAMLIQALRVR